MTTSIIDVHSHPFVPSFLRALEKGSGECGKASGVPLPEWSVEQQLEVMDQHGVAGCVLSVNSIVNVLAEPDGPALARAINEEMAAIVRDHPGRFGALAVVPMHDMDAALAETAYTLDVLKLDGISACTHFRGQHLGEPPYDPWFEEMNRRGTVLFVHPEDPEGFDVKTNRLNVSALEFMFETTRMITTMVLSGAKQRFDKVRIIATHGGGTMPFLAPRIALISQMPWAYRDGPKLSPDEVKEALGSFYFDLTAATSPPQLAGIRMMLPPDHLLMGFDYPMMPPQTIAPALKAFDAQDTFSEENRRKIMHENAAALFPRFASNAQ